MFETNCREEHKQHLNLSHEAAAIIERDMFAFGFIHPNTSDEPNLSSFINKVLEEYIDDADASISKALERIRNSLEDDLKGSKSPDKDTLIDTLCRMEEKRLKQKIKAYGYSENKTFRLNNKNFNTILGEECHEEQYYDNKVSRYIKAVIEEYTTKQPIERERILCREVIRKIETCISNNELVKITLHNGIDLRIKPYAIKADDEKMYNYLVGIDISDKSDKSPRALRISRIYNVKKDNSQSGRITKKEKDELDRSLNKGVQFIGNEMQKFVVRLDDDGKKQFNRTLHLRPILYEVLDNKDMVFICTETQLEFYFFQFGEHAEIIEPEETRRKFLSKYEKAYKKYNS